MHRLRSGLAAGIAALEGRRTEAVGAYRGVVTDALEHGDGFEAANDALTAVVLLGVDEPALRALADEARAVFGRIGAALYLVRLDAAIAGVPVAMLSAPAPRSPSRTVRAAPS
jgi:hypothetical protein